MDRSLTVPRVAKSTDDEEEEEDEDEEDGQRIGKCNFTEQICRIYVQQCIDI